MQWLIDIVYEKVMKAIGGPPFYVYRGDPFLWDFTGATFTKDAAWHVLDLSGIVPAGATAVHFRFAAVSTIVAPAIYFRRGGQTNVLNMDNFKCYVTGVGTDRSCIVALDTNRHIEYFVAAAGAIVIGLVVRGWWL